MRSITLRPGESITIGDMVIRVERSDFKSELSVPPGASSDFPPLDDLRPVLLAIIGKGIRQAGIARRLGVARAMISAAAKPSDKPWMPTYANGRALLALHQEVCGEEVAHA